MRSSLISCKRRRLSTVAANEWNAWTYVYPGMLSLKLSSLLAENTQSVRQEVRQGNMKDWDVGVKDIFCTKDAPTTCASKMLRGQFVFKFRVHELMSRKDWTPPYDATVVKLMRENGARMIGKTNMDEFGMGSAHRPTLLDQTDIRPDQPTYIQLLDLSPIPPDQRIASKIAQLVALQEDQQLL